MWSLESLVNSTIISMLPMIACLFKVNFSMLSYLMVANNNWRLAYLVKNVLSLPWNSAAAEDCRHTNKTSTKANNFMLSENIVSLLCFQELGHCCCLTQNWSPLDARSVLDCCFTERSVWDGRTEMLREEFWYYPQLEARWNDTWTCQGFTLA